MRTRGSIVRLAVAASLVMPPVVGFAGTQSPPGFAEWWQGITSGGTVGPSFDGIRVDYDVEYVEQPSSAELAEMRARVAGHPEHPDHERIAHAERRARRPDVKRVSLWKWKDQWRYSQEYLDSPVSFRDLAWTSRGAWQLSPETLTLYITDPNHVKSRDVIQRASNFAYETTLLMNLGLSGAFANGVVLEPTFTSTGQWSVDAQSAPTSPFRLRVRAEGRWSAQVRTGTIDRVTLESHSASGDSTREDNRAEQWTTPGPEGGPSFAKIVRVMGKDDRPTRVLRLRELSRFDEAGFLAVSAVPPVSGSDPVRGSTTFTRVLDHRGTESLTRSPQEFVDSLPPPVGSASTQETRLRWLGWAFAATLAGSLVFLRIRSRSGRMSRPSKEHT